MRRRCGAFRSRWPCVVVQPCLCYRPYYPPAAAPASYCTFTTSCCAAQAAAARAEAGWINCVICGKKVPPENMPLHVARFHAGQRPPAPPPDVGSAVGGSPGAMLDGLDEDQLDAILNAAASHRGAVGGGDGGVVGAAGGYAEPSLASDEEEDEEDGDDDDSDDELRRAIQMSQEVAQPAAPAAARPLVTSAAASAPAVQITEETLSQKIRSMAQAEGFGALSLRGVRVRSHGSSCPLPCLLVLSSPAPAAAPCPLSIRQPGEVWRRVDDLRGQMSPKVVHSSPDLPRPGQTTSASCCFAACRLCMQLVGGVCCTGTPALPS